MASLLLEGALDALDDGLWVADAEGRIIYANAAFQELTGTPTGAQAHWGAWLAVRQAVVMRRGGGGVC